MDEKSNRYIDKSNVPAIITIFKIVPIPGFCFKGTQKDKTIILQRKVAKPIDQLNFSDNPSAKTTHGLYPILAWISSYSPNPNRERPKQSRKRVFIFGLKFSGFLDDHDVFGILFIFKNIE